MGERVNKGPTGGNKPGTHTPWAKAKTIARPVRGVADTGPDAFPASLVGRHATGSAGQPGDDDTNTAPNSATTEITNKHGDHDLRLPY
jgi:hypothetical protein